jgi:hypothetical protein
MSDDQRRIVISEDDLAPASPAVAPAPPTREAVRVAAPAALPIVEGLGATPRPIHASPLAGQAVTSGTPFFQSVRGRNLAAATAGIVAGWGVSEVIVWPAWTPSTTTSLDIFAGVWVAVLGLFFSVIYAAWEHILAGNWEGVKLAARRVALWGAVLGFASGVVAQIVYRQLIIQILQHATASQLVNISSNADIYLARALAWGLFGAGMGIATAVGTKARDKLVNGLIGGAVGGALAGLVFNWASFNINSGAEARLVGLLVVGAGIGLAIGLVETARRDAWFHVIAGGMAGKEFILYGPECTVGSSPKCAVTLIKDPGIQPFHFMIQTAEGGGAQPRILSAYDGCQVTVNGQPTSRQQLRDGDTIGVGATAISYSERAVIA